MWFHTIITTILLIVSSSSTNLRSPKKVLDRIDNILEKELGLLQNNKKPNSLNQHSRFTNEESSIDSTTRTFRRASDTISDNDPIAIKITLQCNSNSNSNSISNDEETSKATSSSCTGFKSISVTDQGGNHEEGGGDVSTYEVNRYQGSDDADGITYIVDGIPNDDDDMFIKLMSPNNIVLFHTPPLEEFTHTLVNSHMPTVYSRDFDESEIALLTLDDSVLMAEQFIRLYRRHLERVAEDTDTLFPGSNSKDVFDSFLPAAVHLQNVLGRIEEVNKKDTDTNTNTEKTTDEDTKANTEKTTDEKDTDTNTNTKANTEKTTNEDPNNEIHQLEGVKNGFCDTFNRLSKWSQELEQQFQVNAKESKMEEDKTSTTMTPVFSKREQDLLDMGVNSAVGPITDLLKKYAGGDDPNKTNYNPNYENNNKVLNSPEFAQLLKDALTKTAQSSSSVIGLVKKAAQLESDAKDWSEEAQDGARDWAEEMVDKIKQDVKNVDDAAAAVEVKVNNAVDGEKQEIKSVSTPKEESPLVVVCGDHSGVSGLAPGEDQVVKGQFQSHQRKAILKSVFRSNWKSPKIIGILDSIRFQNSLALEHADGTRTVLEANVDVNNLLKSDSSSLNIDLKATHKGKDFAIGGAARIVVAEAGLQQADVSLFATLKRDLPNGSLRTGVFLDLALVPDKGQFEKFKLRTSTVLENEHRGSRLQLDTSFTKHGDGSSTAGLGIGFQQNLGSVINSKWQNVDFTANAQMDKDWGRGSQTTVSASVGLSIKF